MGETGQNDSNFSYPLCNFTDWKIMRWKKIKDSNIFFTGGTGTDLSRLQWPRNSIPRRVKKLSWEDESYDQFAYDRDLSTFTDPDVSVTPLELQLEPSQVGRAIYF